MSIYQDAKPLIKEYRETKNVSLDLAKKFAYRGLLLIELEKFKKDGNHESLCEILDVIVKEFYRLHPTDETF